MIRDNKKLMAGKALIFIYHIYKYHIIKLNPHHFNTESELKILHREPVDNLLKSKTMIKAHNYDICENSCKLYSPDDTETTCPYCGTHRYKNLVTIANLSVTTTPLLIPKATIKMMSIGDLRSNLLVSEETRNLLRYRADREEIPGVIRDFFDGEIYKEFKQKYDPPPDDIMCIFFSDGFINQKKSKQEHIIFHVLILNYDSSTR